MTMRHDVLDAVQRDLPELAAIRRDLHAHPELGMQEHRTADVIAGKLAECGIEVHRGVGGTGVVGVLRAGNGPGAIGLRADIDALPIKEETGLPHASRTAGVMHACGHDGHTAILLGAAKYLAATRRFNGTVNFIFQPAEEGLGGARAMLRDGLFQRFPCDAIYGFHNRPGLPVGRFLTGPAARLAGGAFFDVTITGQGAHGAHPQQSVDPVIVACHLGTAVQAIVSRMVSPMETAVVSVTRIQAGTGHNIIPQIAQLSGTVRAMSPGTMSLIEQSLRRMVTAVAAGFGATAEIDHRVIFAPTVNDPAEATALADAAAELVGEASVDRHAPPTMASEDFGFMLEHVPGAHIFLGNGDSQPVHNHGYDFNDAAIPYGSATLVRVAERRMPLDA